MPDDKPTTTQWARGDQNIQISHVGAGANIQVTLNGRSWQVPLEPATAPPGRNVTSAARLVRARSGVLPFIDRAGLMGRLSGWIGSSDPFAVCLVGGRGGTGKTRLGVELCERTSARAGWLSGMLPRMADPAGLRDLSDTKNPRLVVIDYAETRLEQLEVALPTLQQAATSEHPVRVLLLVRKPPQRSSDWTESLRGGSDWVDAVLDDATVCILDMVEPKLQEREELFGAAAGAFAARAGAGPSTPETITPDLALPAFSSPLFIVIAAYLAIHGLGDLPRTREGLLEELTRHEDRYWERLATGLTISKTLRRRVIALSTLAGASDEIEGANLLTHLPELSDAKAERRHDLARWVHCLYPGPKYWNPLEPDLLGEYLIGDSLAAFPEVLAGALDRPRAESLTQPLDVLARAALNHPTLFDAVRPVLSTALERLCQTAVVQIATETDLALMLGGTTVAGAMERALSVIVIDPAVLPAALSSLPQRIGIALNGLAMVLTKQHVESLTNLALANPAAFTPELASCLRTLSNHLDGAGLREEALTASIKSVGLYRVLTSISPAAFTPELAGSLSTLSNHLDGAGRRDEALTASKESIDLYRELSSANPAAFTPELAGTLSNHSNHLHGAGRRDEALTVSIESVDLYRELSSANPAAFTPELAGSLSNHSNHLNRAGRRDEALTASKESVDLYRELSSANPAAFTPELASCLRTLSNHLDGAGHRDEALTASKDSVDLYRELSSANPAAFTPELADSLDNHSIRLNSVGLRDEALTASKESVDLYRELSSANPAAFNPKLAGTLSNHSIHLHGAGRRDEALAVSIESVGIYQKLSSANPAAFTPELAKSLINLATHLDGAGHRNEALTASKITVGIYRELSSASPAAFTSELADSLTNYSIRLVRGGRRREARRIRREALDL